MANKKWVLRAKKLLPALRARQERHDRWAGKSAEGILADVNAALEAAYIYSAQEPAPQSIFMSYSAYMIMTGHVLVKLGRRKRVWRKLSEDARS